MAYDRYEYAMPDPENYVLKYKDMEDFRTRWCEKSIILELIHTRHVMEELDMFEYCTVIQEELDKRVQKLLQGVEVIPKI